MQNNGGSGWTRLKCLASALALATATVFSAGSAQADCVPSADGPPICLVGTIMSSDYSAALLQPAGKRGVESLRIGALLLDWRVLEITPRAVVLGREDRRVRLALEEHDGEQGAAGPAEPVLAPSASIAAQEMTLRTKRRFLRQTASPSATR
jgi:hypothetical protein